MSPIIEIQSEYQQKKEAFKTEAGFGTYFPHFHSLTYFPIQ